MKKSLFLIPLALGLFACSNDDIVDNPNADPTAENGYIAVNIIDNTMTRAEADYEKDYEDGSSDENAVKSVRFYLFDEKGEPFSTPVCNTTADLLPGTNPNVEKKLEAVIVFKADSKGATGPAQIVAVLNPPTGLPENVSNISALQNEVKNYLLTEKETFVMSNAVYAVDGETEHIAYSTVGKAKPSKAQALADPVVMYVERVVAKVIVNLTLKADNVNGLEAVTITKKDGTVMTNVYKISKSDKSGNEVPSSVASNDSDNPTSVNDTEIFIHLLGWNVTGTANKSRLVKHIDPSWGYNSADKTWTAGNFNWGATNAWNFPDFRRSFWAINPTDFDKSFLNWGKFDKPADNLSDPATQLASKNTNFNGGYEYLQENASWSVDGKTPTYPTKLIVAAELVNKDGEPIELAEWMGFYYTQTNLKQVLAHDLNLYTRTGEVGNYTYTRVTDLGIVFKTATEMGYFPDFDPTTENLEGKVYNRYNVYAQLPGESLEAGQVYYKRTTDGYAEVPETFENINKALLEFGAIKVWNGGHTYYWLDIEHLGGVTTTTNTPEGGDAITTTVDNYGRYGVVRNHVYKYSISSIVGFGVPVYKDSETIYPEPLQDPEYTFMGAQINILSWRIVNNNNAQLGW